MFFFGVIYSPKLSQVFTGRARVIRTHDGPKTPHTPLCLCYKAYPGLGNRSIFYPGSSVGSTITFGIVEDTSSDPTSNISFQRVACACVLLQTCLPGSPGFGSKFWVSTYDRIRRPDNRYVPKIPPFHGGENVTKAYPGLGNRSIFYPGSSAGSTITPGHSHKMLDG